MGYFALQDNRQYFYGADYSPTYRPPTLPG